GQLFDLVAKMGDAARIDYLVMTSVKVLATVAGAGAVTEFVAAAKDLAYSACNLDGTSSEEDELIKEFESLLDDAVVAATNPQPLGKDADSGVRKVAEADTPPFGCHCGCGGTTKGGKFLPGHDARLKS